jgi:hypothetical protein
MTPEQIQELKCALTDATLKDASEDDIFEIAQQLLYDGWGQYSPSELIEEAKYLNVSLPISPT